jgi:hypothetical protein
VKAAILLASYGTGNESPTISTSRRAAVPLFHGGAQKMQRGEALRNFVLALDQPEFRNLESKSDNRYALFQSFVGMFFSLNCPYKGSAEVEIPLSSFSADDLAEGALIGLRVHQEKWD